MASGATRLPDPVVRFPPDRFDVIRGSPPPRPEVGPYLAEPIRSGDNGVRIPAINALVRAVEGRGNPAASQAAVDLLEEPLKSAAGIGGMEVRMMAVAAMEKVGIDAGDVGVKAKAMGLLQAYAGRNGWEPEAKKRAQDAAARVQATVR